MHHLSAYTVSSACQSGMPDQIAPGPMTLSPAQLSSHVAILMGTCHGEAFLPSQLYSIAAQTHANWSLWASDDSSRPDTWQVLEKYRHAWAQESHPGRLHLRKGPQQGFAANFLSLLSAPDIHADYYAFADQDDIWHTDKLARAVAALAAVPPDTPALYTARTRLVDAEGRPLCLSPAASRGPGFGNALVQNIAGGNTMVLNAAARRLLCQTPGGEHTGLHDWWCYLIVSGSGGVVIHDATPCLDYRQHGGNLIGLRRGWSALPERVARVWRGQHGGQLDRNLAALEGVKNRLTRRNAHRLNTYRRSRASGVCGRMVGLRRAGVYRQTIMGTMAMYLATFFKRG